MIKYFSIFDKNSEINQTVELFIIRNGFGQD